MVILDTDILFGILRGNKSAMNKVNLFLENNAEICTTTINALEILRVAYLSSDNEKKLSQIRDILHSIKMLDYDFSAVNINAKIYADLKTQGKSCNMTDMMVAAISISKNKTIITRNTKNYDNVQNLKLETW